MFTKKDKDNNNKESRGPDDEDEDQLEQKQEETIEQETTLDHTTSASNICSVLSSGIFTTIYRIKSTFKICYSLVAIPFKIPSRITFQIRIWICFLMPLGYSDDGSVKDIFFRL